MSERHTCEVDFRAKLVPRGLLARLIEDGRIEPNRVVEIPTVVLVADISNFTFFTDRIMGRLGPEGADSLSQAVNRCFTLMMDKINAAGGETLAISGDSVLSAWYGDDTTLRNSKFVHEHAAAVATCAKDIHLGVASLSHIDDEPLNVHIGIAEGLLLAAAVGGIDGCFEIALGGNVLSDAYTALSDAAAGATVVNTKAHGARYESHLKAESSPQVASQLRDSRELAAPFIKNQVFPSSVIEAFVDAKIAGPDVSGSPREWLAHVRLVTALFIRLNGVLLRNRNDFHRAQVGIRAIQRAIHGRAARLDSVHSGEKGIVVVAFFGLPNRRGEGHARHAVDAAIDIENSLRELGHFSAIGIATGKSFCGFFGNNTRLCYTCLGSVPNLAARYMAQIEDGIVCDLETRRATRQFHIVQSLQPVGLKGIESAQPMWLVIGRREPGAVIRGPQSALVGRTSEMKIVARSIANAHESSQLVIIRGESGIGKSRLTREASDRALELGFKVLTGRADPTSSGQPYAVWRDVFDQLLGIDPARDNSSREGLWRAALKSDQNLLPLLSAINRIEAHENNDTASIDTSVRGARIRALLIGILRDHLSQMPLFIVLEDMHWGDAASWTLAWEATHETAGVIVIVTTREEASHFSTQEVRTDTALDIILKGLSLDEISHFVPVGLGIPSLGDEVTAWIYRRSHGNPLFAHELARDLRDRGLITTEGQLSNSEDVNLDELPLPYSIESAVTARIDRLPSEVQIVLKCASIIGAKFDLETLLDILPSAISAARLPSLLRFLTRAELLSVSEETDLSYGFQHDIIPRVAYGLTSEIHKRDLHAAVANRLARLSIEEAAIDWNVIAFHWTRAERYQEAIICLERAADKALIVGAHREAATCLNRIVRLSSLLRARDPISLAKWHQRLGECYVALGRLSDGAAEARVSLRLLGVKLPESRIGWTGALLRQGGSYFFSPLLRQFRLNSPVNVTLEIATKAMNVVAEESYFSGNVTVLATSNLMAVNLAKSGGDITQAVTACAVMGYLLGLCRLHRPAVNIFERCLEACQRNNNLAGQHSCLGGRAMYELGFARWEAASHSAEEALKLCRRIGNQQDIERALTILGLGAHYRGDFEASYQLFADVYESASRRGNRQHTAWGAYGMAQNLLPMGRAHPALTLLERAMEILASVEDKHSLMICRGLLALAYLQTRDYRRALDMAMVSARDARQIPPNNFGSLAGYSNPAFVLVALWGRALRFDTTKAARLERLVVDAIGGLARYSRVFPVGTPRTLLLRGWLCWHRDDPNRARRFWLKCLTRATALEMPYEQAFAHWALRGVALDLASREAHQQEANELLRPLNAVLYPIETGGEITKRLSLQEA